MDRKLQQQEIERLIQVGSAARSGITAGVATLQRQLDVPQRIRESLRSHPGGWLFGSLAVGLLASKLLRRPPAAVRPSVPVKKRSLALTLLGLTLTAVRPFAKVWLADQVKTHLAGRFPPTTGTTVRSKAPTQLL